MLAVDAGLDVPGTYVFDGEQSRRGYRLNKLCLSLRFGSNRALFRHDEAAYCDRYGLAPAQQQAVLSRDWPRLLELGGSIFCVFKLAMVDHRSMQYLGGVFAGMTEQEFTDMMAAGGRPGAGAPPPGPLDAGGG